MRNITATVIFGENTGIQVGIKTESRQRGKESLRRTMTIDEVEAMHIKGKHRGVKLSAVWDMDNLIAAEKEARKGKGNKYGVRKFDKHREENLRRIQQMLMTRTYHSTKPKQTEQYCPCGKVRLITKQPYCPDHIIHHALMRVLFPTMTASYYHNSFASIKGRGTEMARRRVRRFIDKHKHLDLCFAKLDFTKFYQNIDQGLCYKALCEMYHDDGIRWLLKEVVTTLPEGLGIGLYPIQPIANFYMNRLPRLIERKFSKQIHTFIYCDDIVLLGYDTKTVWQAVELIRNYAKEALQQPLHTEVNVEHLSNDVALDFVGYKFFKDYTLIRKKMRERFRKMYHTCKDELLKQQATASYKGWLMHSNGRNLWHEITGMKKFSELNIDSTISERNGERYFNVPCVPCSFLVNRTIIVKDFQENVTTKNGGGRYAVLVEEGGRECKFLTNNPMLKNVLDQCREQDAMPFEAMFKSRNLTGGKLEYYFE